jgi:outer membrane protein assembly factor BamD (BamD/ComL family)
MKKQICCCLTLLLWLAACSLSVGAQEQQSEEERALYQKYYDAVQKKNAAQSCALAQDFLQKFPKSQYAKYAQQTLNRCRLEQFQKALSEY